MGGTVAETIRKENGEVIKMARRTGAYNWMFFTKEFAEGKFDEAIEKHVQIFREMQEDFQSGEPYKFPMSPVYGWCNETAPIDYGLVVIDIQKKKIHSMQGYDHPGYEYFNMFSKYTVLDKEREEIFQYLIENNLLNILNRKNKNEVKDIEQYFGKNYTLEKIRDQMDVKMKGIFNDYLDLVFYPKLLDNFEYISYEENPEGTFQLLKNLIDDGFKFNQEEMNMWKERVQECDIEDFMDDADDENEEVLYQKAEEKKADLIKKMDTLFHSNQEKKTTKKIK
jgi:hypothetical protein